MAVSNDPCSGGDPVLRAQKKALQRVRLSVGGDELQRSLQRLPGRRDASEGELQLRDPRPREAEIRRALERLPRRRQRAGQIAPRLPVVGLGEPFAARMRRPPVPPRLQGDRGDHVLERHPAGVVATERGEGAPRLLHLADGEQNGGAIESGARRAIAPVMGKALQRTEQVARAVGLQRIAQRLFLGGGKTDRRRVEHAGIIEAPLNDVYGIDHGRLARGLPDFGHPLLATVQQDPALLIVEFHRSVEHRQRGAAFGVHGKRKLRPPERAIGRRRMDLPLLILLPAPEIRAAALLIEDRRRAGTGWGDDFQEVQLIHAQNGEIAKTDRCTAEFPSLDLLAGDERMACRGGFPRGWLAPGFHDVFAFHELCHRRRFRGTRARQPEPAQPASSHQIAEWRRPKHCRNAS